MALTQSLSFQSYIILATFCCILLATSRISYALESDNTRDFLRDPELIKPTVLIVLFVRNKEHILPHSLQYIQNLDYPQDRIVLWIKADHNIDNSVEVLTQWVEHVEPLYHRVVFSADETEQEYPGQEADCHWTDERFDHLISLKQEALDYGRDIWADFVFFLDSDVLLLNKNTLNELIAQDKTIIAPLLNTTASEYYSNFWAGMDSNGYYKRVPEYMPIFHREWEGCFQVANVHTAVLVNLRHQDSLLLSFDPAPPLYEGSQDDIIIFAHSAMYNEIPMHLLNTDFYGYMPVPLQNHNTLPQEREQLLHIQVESLIYQEPLQSLPYIEIPQKEKTLLGFDQVYMINLLRRPDRREKMLRAFDVLGIKAKIMDAVDGMQLNQSYLDKLQVKMLDGYVDPYHGRPLTMGEIGCFLSHYYIWEEVLEHKYEKVIVFEDDLRFEPYFNTRINNLLKEVALKELDWELIYLGRKRLNFRDESYLEDSEILVYPKYSYWTLSYILSYNGAKKLMDQKPLEKLIPVDEYLPVMFDEHPVEEWKMPFSPRDLKAFSVHPLFIFPTHYTGEPGYFTDTDHSQVIHTGEETVKNTKEFESGRGPQATGPTDSGPGDQRRLGDFGGKTEL